MDAVERADSGHPGTAMALAPVAYVLWQRHLRYNPANPDWFGRDRFVLSAGHACMLLYAVLYLTGYDLSLDDIKQFRQWGAARRATPSTGSPRASRPRPARSVRGGGTPWGWRSRRRTSRSCSDRKSVV